MKKVDERKIKAIGLYYTSSNPETYGKMIESCIQAGYNKDYAKGEHNRILEIDSFKDRDWADLKNLLPQLIKVVKIWLEEHQDNVETKDIREIWKGIRLIGDSVGKFVKREEKITHNIEEKREIKVFATLNEERKYWLELAAIGNQRIKAIDVEETKNGLYKGRGRE